MEIKKVLFQDYQEILILTKKNNLDILDEEDWKNLWIKNPFFNENKEKWTVGWKAVYKNKIVGVTLNIPFIFLYEKKTYLAAVCNNYVVDKKHRNCSLLLRHHFLTQEEVDLCITNSANEASEQIMEAFKAKKIIQYDYQNRLIYLINKNKIFFQILKKFNFIKLIKNITNLFKLKKKISKKICSFDLIESFDEDFKNFDNKIFNNEKIYSSKNFNWLSWKYSKYIRNKNLIIVKIFKENKFIGFIVLIKSFEKKYNLSKLSIVEVTLLDEDTDILESAFDYCIKLGKSKKFDLIDVIGFNKKKRQAFEKVGFIKKKSKNFNFLIKNNNKYLEKILFNNTYGSDFSLTDGDGIFYL